MTRRVFSLSALALAVACGGEQATDPSVIRADSAGVRIVTSTGPDRELAWRFERLDVLRDSLGEPWLFTNIRPSRVLTDRAGRVYVLEADPAIRRFGRDGRYERSIGRRGNAPGEMQRPMALRQHGDTLTVLDGGRRALVRWGPDFEPVNDILLAGALSGLEDIAFRFGGLWVVTRALHEETRQLSTSLFLDTLASAPLFTVDQPLSSQVSACGGRSSIAFPPFFGPQISLDVAGARMLANAGPEYDLHLYEGSNPVARIRRNLPIRAPTEDDLRRLFPTGLKLEVPGEDACIFGTDLLMKEAGVAPLMPFVNGLALLSDGTMWVQRSLRNEKPVVLDVFGSDGAYAGTTRGMHLPVGLLPSGELLVPLDDEDSGGVVIARMLVAK